MNLHDALRQTTRHSHEALERLPGMAILVDPSITLADYQRSLRRQAGHSLALYETLMISTNTERPESRLLQPAFRPDALCADLDYFGIDPTDLAFDDIGWLCHADACYQIGVLYVHLSTTLRSGLIAKHLERYLDLTPDHGGAYHQALADSGHAWETLVDQLQDMPDQGKQARAVLSGARQACYARHRWLAEPEMVDMALDMAIAS